MIAGLEIKTMMICPHCSSRNQVIGLKKKILCYRCLKQLDIQKILAKARVAGIKYHFGGYYDIIREAMAVLEEGQKGEDSSDRPGNYNFSYRRKMPCCPSCNKGIDVKILLEAAGNSIRCPHCKRFIPLRKNDGKLTKWDKRIACVLNDTGEDLDFTATIGDGSGQEGQVIRCSGCGGGLAVNGRERILACGNCGEANVVPDHVWLRVNAAPEEEPFFLIIDYNEHDLIDAIQYFLNPSNYSWSDDETVREALRRKLAATAKSLPEQKLKELLSGKKNLALKKALLEIDGPGGNNADALLADEDSRVQAMILEKKELPTDVLNKMALSGKIEVRYAMADRADLTEEVLEILSKDPDARVRKTIALHPGATKEILKRLKKDEDDSVRIAVKENGNYHKYFIW